MDTEAGPNQDILLVEDDSRDGELTLAALAECQLASRVAIARNGEQALDYLYRRGAFKSRSGGNPVLVLLDLKMPKVNGLEVLKRMKGDAHLQTIPVVVLSSSREPSDLIECYHHAANAYVVKPVDFTEFMKAVRLLGIFWATVNEPPPVFGRERSGIQSGQAAFRLPHEVEPAIPEPLAARRG